VPRRRQQQGLERVLGANALFATAYGNVGSSIYYALGLTASIALGLTPLVFIISGLIFAATAATYAEGTVRYPEAGGSSSFARHAFNELVSFGAAWAQMLNYVITVAISVIFVPHYLSIFWEPLRTTPWDVIVGIAVTWLLVGLNIVGIKEAASLNVLLAVLDFATQLLLVGLGFFLVFSPHIITSNIHWGVAPTWSNFALAIPVAMIAYTGKPSRTWRRRRAILCARSHARSRGSRLPSSRSTSRCPGSRSRRCRSTWSEASTSRSSARTRRSASKTTRCSGSSRTSASTASS
jgi:APA family basic amino acid/polyamine antiporter